MKKYLQNYFLPIWAKETLLRDKRNLERENLALKQKIESLQAYIDGLHMGLRSNKRIHIINRGGEA
ncbi:MAG: hypothetical protein E7421_00355 [Ruminococcaceae bacterium]|nr:hypothetical protein [Oscillospiraceae bacterium]